MAIDLQLADYRKTLASGFTEASGVRKNIASGMPPETLGLYIGVFPPNNNPNAEGTVVIEVSGSRWGSRYFRRFQMRVNDLVAINADGLSSVTVDVVGLSVADANNLSGVQVTAMPSPNIPDPRYARTVLYFQEWTGGVLGTAATTQPVPQGAVGLIPYTAIPDWNWVIYDRSNNVEALVAPQAAGTRAGIQGTHFKPTTGGSKAVWVIEL